MRCLELFSGMGGLAKGLENASFKHVQFIEFNKHACASLRENFSPKIVAEKDIRLFDFSTMDKVDLIAGGPPCQPFSQGGRHHAYLDPRDMFPYAIQAVNYYKPKAFLFENVKGLLRRSFSNYFEYILLRLTFPSLMPKENESWMEHLEKLRKVKRKQYGSLKYRVSYRLLNAADFGVPQVRERVFIVGLREDVPNVWEFPRPTHSRLSLEREQYVTGDYWLRHNQPRPNNFSTRNKGMERLELPELDSLKPWRTVRDAIGDLPHPQRNHGIPDHIFQGQARIYPGHTGSHIDAPAKTLKAGAHGVPGGENMIRYEDDSVRYFSVYEGKILQTFPRNFKVTGAWGEAMRQIGNAVPPLLAQAIARKLCKTISIV